MGFGTLFVGYFLLLNVTNYRFTDLIAGLIMVMALYKLMKINDNFKITLYFAAAFSILGVLELTLAAMTLFDAPAPTLAFISPMRSALLCVMTVFMLFAIRDVAGEVGLKALAVRTGRMVIPTVVIYVVYIILNTPSLFTWAPSVVIAVISVISIFAMMFLIIYNLISIWSCYMNICMPGQKEREEKKSKLGFVNKFREHEAEKVREYAEYKAQKRNSKDKKK